jgi:hypothetical protein
VPEVSHQPAVRAAAAAAVGVTLLGATVHLAQPRAVTWPPPAATVRGTVGPDGLSLALAGDGVPRQLVLQVAGREATLTTASTRSTLYRLPDVPAEPGAPVVVAVTPAGQVLLNPATTGLWQQTTAVEWSSPGPAMRVPPPTAGTATTPAAASVDETDRWGVRALGVAVRSSPSTTARRLATVHHGDRLAATCWVEGELVTSELPDDVSDDDTAYATDVWFRVLAPVGLSWRSGFVSDRWFSRTALRGRLGLAECH